jgi:hypothetical protein
MPASPDDRWLLVDPAVLAARATLEPTADDFYRELDGASATERRLLAPGLPEWSGQPVEAAGSTDHWSLVGEADTQAPPGAAFEVFVLDRAASLVGTRPALSREVSWRALTDPETNRWIQRAVRTADALRVTVGESDGSGTRFSTIPVAPPGSADGALRLRADASEDRLSLADGGSLPADDATTIGRERPPLVVSMEVAEGRTGDAAAVLAATRAVATHLGRPMALATGEDRSVDVALGLGTPAGPVDAAVRLTDSDSGAPCRQSAFVEALADPWLSLQRCGGPEPIPALWRGGWGQPLLSEESSDERRAYRWHGRFDRDWSSVTEAGLPHLLLDLIAPADDRSNGSGTDDSDRRAGIPGHGVPTRADRPAPVAPNRLPERIAWALVAVLFVTDRLLVRRGS